MIYVILFILLSIAVILDFWPDSKERKELIKKATGDEKFYYGLSKKYQPTNQELREMIK